MRLAASHLSIIRFGAIGCLALILAGALAPGAAFAADPPVAQEPDWGRQADLVLTSSRTRLNLTDAQVTSLKPIVERHLKRLRGLFEQYTGQGVAVMPALLGEFREARQAFQTNLEPILNPTQMKEIAAIRREVDQEIRKAFCEARLKRLTDRLGLSPGQAAAVRPILSDEYDRRLAILSFHIDAQGGPETRRPLGPELQQVRVEVDARLGGVLTTAQFQTYKADGGTTGAPPSGG